MAVASNLRARSVETLRRGVTDGRYLMGGCLGLASATTMAAVLLGSSPDLSGPLGPASPAVLGLLGVAFILIVVLALLLFWRLWRLVTARATDAGARLHLRFVTQFAVAAVVPAVIVALFFGVLVTRGVESWFSARVQTVVENSATVARSYIQEQQDYISRHMNVMAQTLDQAAPSLADSPIAYGRFLRDLTAEGGFSAAYVIDGDGRLLARADAPDVSAPFLAPPPSSFLAANQGDVSAAPFESTDLIRALYRLRSYPDAYLYVVRPLDHGIFRHLRETEGSLIDYRLAKHRRVLIQAAFGFAYLETVLIVLLGAVWLGMNTAEGIAAPIGRLIVAAGQVAAGDLSARVDVSDDPGEIAVLSRAFNRMTGDIRNQQEALRAAREDAELRRLFTEAVLLGVSAGVIGLDSQGRISALNRQAERLLKLPDGAGIGGTLAEVAPALAPLAAQVREGEESESHVEVPGDGDPVRLRVSARRGAQGVVLTFDDVTGLINAQRTAAWRDVARRIAHEIKNPLTPIQLSAERLRRKYRGEIIGDVEVFDRCIDTIIRQVGDIGRMVDEFSAFARMPQPQFNPWDMTEIIRQAAFAQRVADPGVDVDIVEPMSGITVICDGRIVAQALGNVLKNAGESIRARMRTTPEPAGKIQITLTSSAERIDIEVEDNGVGFPRTARERLTEPYVTTREKGAGLGLAIVKRILEEHGGRLVLSDARSGVGARVVLSFPTPEKAPENARQTAYRVHA